MPGALPVDWNEVRTLAIALGSADQAADHFGIPRPAARKRASREKWFVSHKAALVTAKAVQEQQREDRGMSHGVTTAAEAMQNLSPDSKLHGAIALNKAMHHFASLDGEAISTRAAEFKAMASTGVPLHGWNSEDREGSTGFALHLHVASAPPPLIDLPE